MSKDVHISINKKRLLLQIVILSIVAIAALMASFALADKTGMNPIIWKGMGIGICIFSVITAGQKVKKRNEPNAGITINKEGINDKSSDIGIGLIQWKDISSLNEEESEEAKLVIIHIKRHNEYLKRAKNSAVRRLLEQNIRKFETPVVIDAKFLEASFDEVMTTISQEIKRRKK